MKSFWQILLIFIFLGIFAMPSMAEPAVTPAVNYALVRQKGIDAYNKGNYKQAIDYLTSIPKTEHTLEIVIYIANSYESIGDTRSAVILLESLNKRNLNNYTAFYNLGNIYLKAKVYKNAIESYKTCTRLNSRFAPAYYNLGITYYEIKDYNKALFNFEKAIRLNPSNKDYIYNAGVCLEAMGNIKEANEYFKRAK